jgi:hypothetical protein
LFQFQITNLKLEICTTNGIEYQSTASQGTALAVPKAGISEAALAAEGGRAGL